MTKGSLRMGKEEKRREVDGSAVEGGGDAKPVRELNIQINIIRRGCQNGVIIHKPESLLLTGF